MVTKMNELIIRLQYENNFLKEKLNLYPSLTQINTGQSGNAHTNIAQCPNSHHLKQID